MRILIVSSESLPGSEDRNLPLALELIRRGHRVRHAGPAQGLPGFNGTAFEPEFTQRTEAAACRTELFHNWGRLKKMIAWAQVVVLSMAKGYHEAADYAADMSKVIIYLADTSLHPWVHRADLICAGSPYERERFISLTENRGIPELEVEIWTSHMRLEGLTPKDIRLTGTTLHDQASPGNRRLTRSEFYRRYNLDETKATAVWLPSSPACHSEWFKGLYQGICGAVEQAGLNLIIKPHPRDYVQAKQWATYEDTVTPTWEQLAPGVGVCRAEDKWDCFQAADVLLSSWTTTAIEAGLVRTPMLLVDKLQFGLEIIRLPESRLWELLPQERYKCPGRRSLGQVEDLLEVLEGRVDDNTWTYLLNCLESERQFYRTGFPEYIGTDCTMEELPRVLKEGLYRFDDQRVFDDYAVKYSAGLDGKSYLRIADTVESVTAEPRLAAKLEAQKSFPRRYGVPLRHSWNGFSRRVRNRLAGAVGRRG